LFKNIAIIDDEHIALDMITDNLKRIFLKKNLTVEIKCFDSIKNIENSLNTGSRFDIFFLDIDLKDGDGIIFSKKIRKLYPDSFIIFISNKENQVFEAFKSKAFRFIRKTYFQTDILEAIDSLIDCYHEFHFSKTISFNIKNKIYQYQINDIVYIESKNQNIMIMESNNRLTTIRYKISDAEKLLNDKGFIRIHKGYLVNCFYIFCIHKNEVVLDNNLTLPLSKYRYQEVLKSFLHYVDNN